MKTLKAISTAIMLITGSITAITGAVETFIKLVERISPLVKSAPIMGERLETISGTPFQESFLSIYQGPTLLLVGGLIIYTALWLTNKYIKTN